MKVRERILDDDGKVIIHQQHDFNGSIARARQIRDLRGDDRGDWQHVGTLPMKLVYEECKMRGVRFDDAPAVQDVMRSMLLDSDYSAFRTNGRF